jgi:hypothetical protein
MAGLALGQDRTAEDVQGGAPLAHASTMRARATNAAEIERERAIDCSCACSACVNTSSAFDRPIGIAVSPVPKDTENRRNTYASSVVSGCLALDVPELLDAQ